VTKCITLKIARGAERDTTYWERFSLPAQEARSVLDCLILIRDEYDDSLAFRSFCAKGDCGSCAVLVDGVACLACNTMIAPQKKSYAVEPLPLFPRQKDLIVDKDAFYHALAEVCSAPVTKQTQSRENRESCEIHEHCVFCGICTSLCPVKHTAGDFFAGPAALLRAWVNLHDERRGKRSEFREKIESLGLWECDLFLECAQRCPKGLNPAEAIIYIRNTGKI
jgi:succinate dehydrogenase / fumarate reductase iron-sulfur subunit